MVFVTVSKFSVWPSQVSQVASGKVHSRDCLAMNMQMTLKIQTARQSRKGEIFSLCRSKVCIDFCIQGHRSIRK